MMPETLVPGSEHGSSTLKLLEQYDSHIQERDKNLDYIEKGDTRFHQEHNTKPSYDQLYQENVKLRLKVEEYEAEIKGLNELISRMKDTSEPRATEYEQQQIVVDTPTDATFSLPQRSVERVRHKQSSSSADSSSGSHSQLPRSPGTFEISTKSLKEELRSNNISNKTSNYEGNVGFAVPENVPQSHLEEGSGDTYLGPATSNVLLGSPATSVTYTTSRISINSPSPNISTKNSIRRPNSPIPHTNGALSPQRANRVTHLINNEIHSPLKEQFSGTDRESFVDLTSGSEGQFAESLLHKSPLLRKVSKENEAGLEFSPSSKQNLSTFTEMINKTFGDNDKKRAVTKEGEERDDEEVTVKPPIFEPSLTPNKSLSALASPVMIQHSKGLIENNTPVCLPRSNVSANEILKHGSQDNLSTISSAVSVHQSFSPRSVSSISRIQPPSLHTSLTNTDSINTSPLNSAKSGNSSMLNSDIPLFVQPSDFSTITLDTISTLYSNLEDSTKSILFSVIDKKSSKEIFRFAKSLEQLADLDQMLKARLMEQYHLPTLPNRQLFQSITPVKVDLRREQITGYFITLFENNNLPPLVSLKLAQFISTDTVISMPSELLDHLKEGALLVRKSKALGSGNTWKVRHAIIEDHNLLIVDHNSVIETIRLANSTIELQANLPDDKYGTKNGFVVNESKKSGLSNTTKHYFSAETAKQREEWIGALIKVCGSAAIANRSEFSSAGHDQGSISDASMDRSFNSSIGPMVNLEVPPKPQQTDNVTSEVDKDTKRNRMRSFFPFKKTQPQFSASSLEISKENDDVSDSSYTAALKSMNLNEVTASNLVFGSDIKHCLSLSSKTYQDKFVIPSVVYRCLEYLYRNHAINEEGIFRLSGSSALIKAVQEQFDKDYDINLCEYNTNNDYSKTGSLLDVNTVTGVLKLYFRRLPHLVFGDDLYEDFRSIVEENSNDPPAVALRFRNVVKGNRLQKENYSLMYVLFELLLKISDNSKENKMNLRNLCIVFSPTLNIPVNILQPFIEDFQCIFNDHDPLSANERQSINLKIPHM